MNTVYIDTISKVELLADLFNNFYNLPTCSLVASNRATFKPTLPTRHLPYCTCTAEAVNPLCPWYAIEAVPELGSGSYAGKAAIVLTEQFINEEVAPEDQVFLFETYPSDWLTAAQVSESLGV